MESVRPGALGAGADYLDGVLDVCEAVDPRGLVRPALDVWPLDLDGGSTEPANEVVMVVVAASTVQRLAVVRAYGVYAADFGERAEPVVDGGEADPLAALAQLGMQLLCRAEAVALVEQGRQGTLLACRPARRRSAPAFSSAAAHNGLTVLLYPRARRGAPIVLRWRFGLRQVRSSRNDAPSRSREYPTRPVCNDIHYWLGYLHRLPIGGAVPTSHRPRSRGVGRLRPRWILVLATAEAASALLTGCAGSSAAAPSVSGVVTVVAAENEYGDVAAQIGGRYVHVVSVESDPNTDPHAYEVSTGVARAVAGAGLVIQNGIGYDGFMARIESASPSAERRVIDVQHLLGLPGSTPNPHLWYAPTTMPAVAQALVADLSALDPSHASYFAAGATRFDESLRPWLRAVSYFKARYGGTAVATTEPVADYLLRAMGIDDLTPFTFQADVMNGTDPSPQYVALEDGLLSRHEVRLFVYDQQVVDSLTSSIRRKAESSGIPEVGVYETMPTPGYDYQSWMLAETEDIQRAVVEGTSTVRL